MLALSLSAGIIHAGPATEPAEKADAQQRLDAQLDRILPEISFDAVALSDVLDFFRDVSGANLFVDWKYLKGAGVDRNVPITLRLKNRKFRDVLQSVCDAAAAKGKIDFQAQDGLMIISTKEGAAGLVDSLKADISGWDEKNRRQMLRKIPEVTFDAVSLADVIDFLRDVSGVKLEVDWDAFAKAGTSKDTPITARLRNLPLNSALRVIFHGATDQPVEITEKNGLLHIAPAPTPQKTKAERRDK